MLRCAVYEQDLEKMIPLLVVGPWSIVRFSGPGELVEAGISVDLKMLGSNLQ